MDEVTPPAPQPAPTTTATQQPVPAAPRAAGVKAPLGIRDYWPRYHRRIIFMEIGMQLVITLAIGWTLIATGVLQDGILLMIVMIAVFAATTGINLILVWLIASPLADLSAALAHVAGEPSATPPPNPNFVRYQADGFSELLKTIYSLASKDPTDSTPANTTNASAVLKGLSETKAGVVIMDHEHKIIYANRAAPVRVDTDNVSQLSIMFDGDDTLTEWLHQCEREAVHATKQWRRLGDKLIGEEDRRIFDVSASYEKGSEAEVVLIFYDLTETYQPEEDELDFIAFAAHELRGPITVIRGYLDVFGDELGAAMSAEQRELLQRLVVSANRLSSYINNILNASRFDRRHLRLHLVEDTMANVYATIADDMYERAVSQNRLLSVQIPTDLPTIACDRGSLSEVLGNLIDNAIKYSNEGGTVTVSARADENSVTVSVEDHGIGMPGSVVHSLFHKFYRSHRSRETVAGTGIGLYISKAIVESHGGQIGVRSTEGQGSTFEFSVPIYAKVAAQLAGAAGANSELIAHGEGWIKNHAMFRG